VFAQCGIHIVQTRQQAHLQARLMFHPPHCACAFFTHEFPTFTSLILGDLVALVIVPLKERKKERKKDYTNKVTPVYVN